MKKSSTTVSSTKSCRNKKSMLAPNPIENNKKIMTSKWFRMVDSQRNFWRYFKGHILKISNKSFIFGRRKALKSLPLASVYFSATIYVIWQQWRKRKFNGIILFIHSDHKVLRNTPISPVKSWLHEKLLEMMLSNLENQSYQNFFSKFKIIFALKRY